MKVFSVPASVPELKVDYFNYDHKRAVANEDAHKAAVKAELLKMGYTGPHTGKIYRQHVADGYAQYMFADGPKACLIHLPYGDAYQSRDVQFLPKRVVLERIESAKHGNSPLMKPNRKTAKAKMKA